MNADELVEKIEALLPDVTPGDWEAEHGGGRGAWIRASKDDWAAMSCGNTDAEANANAAYLVAVQPQNIALLLSDLASSADRIAEMEKALQDIAESDDIENALDPARNKRVAIQALAARAALGGRSDG